MALFLHLQHHFPVRPDFRRVIGPVDCFVLKARRIAIKDKPTWLTTFDIIIAAISIEIAFLASFIAERRASVFVSTLICFNFNLRRIWL